MTIWDILAALIAVGLILGGVAYFRWRRDQKEPLVLPDDETTPRPPQRPDRTL